MPDDTDDFEDFTIGLHGRKEDDGLDSAAGPDAEGIDEDPPSSLPRG